MRTKKIFLTAVILFSSLTTATFAQGYKIKVKINHLKDSTLYLAHYLSGSIYPDDTIKLNKDGVGYAQGKEKLNGGMYLVYLPNKQYFDILIDKNQVFSIENDTTGFLENMKVTGSDINFNFYEYQRFIQKKKKERDAQEVLKDSTNDEKNKAIDVEIEKLTKEVEDYTQKVIVDNKDNFLGAFLKSLQKVDVPDAPKDENGKIIDSTFQYYYYKNHFFDNFDYSDSRFLRTPIYENKIMQYLETVIPQTPDSICKEVGIILERSRKDEDVFRFNLVKLFNHYAKSNIMGMENVYIYIGEKFYIPYATWSDSAFIDKLKTHVKESKPTLVGEIAPEVEMFWVSDQHFKDAANDTTLKKNVYVGTKTSLHQVEAPYTILIFWEKDCGHCRKTIQELHTLYTDEVKAKGIKVVAFHMLFNEEGKVKWTDFVNEHNLYGWMNVWNTYTYQFKIDYNIKSTPLVMVLDKDKKIIAKRVSADQAIQIATALSDKDNKK